MPILAMTREIGSLGSYIGQEAARRLGYEFIRQEIIAEAARLYTADPGSLVATVEAVPKAFEARQAATRRNFAFLAAEVLNVALRDNVVIQGRWSTLLLRGVGHALRVRLCAPIEIRAERLAGRLGVPVEEATRRIRRSDEGVRERIRQFFEVAWDDPCLYDLTLNTGGLSVAEATDLLVYTAGLPAWQSTESSRAALWDAVLAARVRAAIKDRTETRHLDVTIRCRSGRIELVGTVPGEGEREAVERIALGHAGAQAVENRLVVTRMPVP